MAASANGVLLAQAGRFADGLLRKRRHRLCTTGRPKRIPVSQTPLHAGGDEPLEFAYDGGGLGKAASLVFVNEKEVGSGRSKDQATFSRRMKEETCAEEGPSDAQLLDTLQVQRQYKKGPSTETARRDADAAKARRQQQHDRKVN